MSSFFDSLWKMVVFFGIQYALGRRGSFPYGILVRFSLLKISLLVIISDVLQTIFLLNFFDYVVNHWTWLKKVRHTFSTKKKGTPDKQKDRWQKFKKYGHWGLFFISALPYAGGALTGSIVATSLKMDKKKAFVLIILGTIVSTALYYLGFAGILSIFKKG